MIISDLTLFFGHSSLAHVTLLRLFHLTHWEIFSQRLFEPVESANYKCFFFIDYDECNPPANIHVPDCGPNAICTNIEATYNCTCLEGYARTGVNCTGEFPVFFNTIKVQDQA